MESKLTGLFDEATREWLRIRNIYLIPCFYGRADFAAIVRSVVIGLNPSCICVELPPHLSGLVEQGVDRLPYPSMVLDFSDHAKANFIPIEPCDPIIEGIRLANERQIPLHYIDSPQEYYFEESLDLPSAHAVKAIGIKQLAELICQVMPLSEVGSEAFLLESEMAHQIRVAEIDYDKVVVILGFPRLQRIAEALRIVRPRPMLPEKTLGNSKLVNVNYRSLRNVFTESPFVTYYYEITRRGWRYNDLTLSDPPNFYQQIDEQEWNILAEQSKALLEVMLTKLSSAQGFDAYDAIREGLKFARSIYQKEWDHYITGDRLAQTLRYARNLSLLEDSLTPEFFNLLLAAKQSVNEDFAWEILRVMHHYPFVREDSNLETLDWQELPQIGDLILDLRRRMPIHTMTMRAVPMRDKPKEANPGDWKKAWDRNQWHNLSYPPEDVVVENFFKYLKEKAKQILSAGNLRVVEFSSSIADGIDIRETLRNFHLDKIYVREERPQLKGMIGSLMVLFDHHDRLDHYPFEITWLGEHQNESDLALFSTMPGEKFSGPGISRCEYGGLLAVFPPRGITDVWSDSDLDRARNRNERLLMGAIKWNLGKYIAYAAKSPPPSALIEIAERAGQKIIYIPLEQFPEDTLKKLRCFHILNDRKLRDIAHKYIRLD